MNTKTLLSFGIITTAEGERVSYSYSEMDADGNLISTETKGVFVCNDKAFIKAVDVVKKHIRDHMENAPVPHNEAVTNV